MPLLRSANMNLLVEIVIRISVIALFCYMETMTPYVQDITKQDMETIYKHSRIDSFVPGSTLWAVVVSVPCLLSLLAWAVCSDAHDALEILLAWSLTLGFTGVITDFFKLFVGRPRPDFFYRCFPDGAMTPDLTCTGDKYDVMEGRKSFPSGHSSLSFCSLGTLSFWLCGRLGILSQRRGSGARLVCSGAPLLAASAIAMSRVIDHHHHWQDVLTGSILGLTMSLFIYRQHYNPLSSDLAGVPYVVSNLSVARYKHVKDVSPVREEKEESPLLTAKKEDKWI